MLKIWNWVCFFVAHLHLNRGTDFDQFLVHSIFFLSQQGKSSVWRIPPTVETWAEDSVRLLLTKNPACSCNYPWCQVQGISFEWFPRLWQTFVPISGPSRVADTSTSNEQTRPGSEPQPSAHGVNPRVPLGMASHFGPVRHEGLYRIAPRMIDTFVCVNHPRGSTTTTWWGHSRQGSISLRVRPWTTAKCYIC